MNTIKGSVVRANAGRDKGSFFVVMSVEGKYAYIADGRRRKVENPKKKKLIHLSASKTVIDGSIETNPQVRRILNDFINGNGG